MHLTLSKPSAAEPGREGCSVIWTTTCTVLLTAAIDPLKMSAITRVQSHSVYPSVTMAGTTRDRCCLRSTTANVRPVCPMVHYRWRYDKLRSLYLLSCLLCIGYNTVWSELCECNEQTHSRQCCNLLISWRVHAGVWYIVAAGLAGSASADQSTVSIHVVVVTSAVACRHVVVVSVGLEWMWQILFGLFWYIGGRCNWRLFLPTSGFLHPLRG